MTLHLWLAGYRNELRNLGFDFSDEIIVKDFFFEHHKAEIKYPNINFKSFVSEVHKYINNHASDIKIYSNTYEILEKLKEKNIILTLHSSTPRELLNKELKYTKLNNFFSITLAGDEITKHKPDPEGFNKIIESGNLNRKNTIILGDSHNDILASKNANIDSCLFLPTENKIFYDFEKLKETNPTYNIENLKDFIEIIFK